MNPLIAIKMRSIQPAGKLKAHRTGQRRVMRKGGRAQSTQNRTEESYEEGWEVYKKARIGEAYGRP